MFSYTIKRKKIKNIILKITRNGTLEVSAPLKTPESVLKEFIFSKTKWIQKHLKLQELNHLKYEIDNLKEIYLFGEKILIPDEILFPVKNRIDNIKKFYKFKASEIITPLVKKYSLLTELEVEYITYRFMKTRWGSCNSKKRYLNLNTLLVASPLEAIEYIVLHEIAHIKYPHHQKEFWDFITFYMPDWKMRKKKLIYFDL